MPRQCLSDKVVYLDQLEPQHDVRRVTSEHLDYLDPPISKRSSESVKSFNSPDPLYVTEAGAFSSNTSCLVSQKLRLFIT